MNYFLNLCRNKIDVFIYNLKSEEGKSGNAIFTSLFIFLILVIIFLFRNEILDFIRDFVKDVMDIIFEESGADGLIENSDFTS